MKDDLLKELSPEQERAVTTIAGPILILAGAGSGKTRVITYRIAYLISQGVAPENILAVTFTNKAAGEMKDRVERLLGSGKGKGLWIGTFHSICVRILRREIKHLGYEPSFSIYDKDDQKKLIKDIIKDLGYDSKVMNPSAIGNKISGIKNESISPEDFKSTYANTFFEERVAEIYDIYEKRKRKNNSLDFDDLIIKAIEVLQGFPEIRSKYQKIFEYILVDEYQDTNHSQYLLIKLLINEKENICVVGDPDQSIYNFRGADIRNILNFEKDHPSTKVFLLEENYRSTKMILDCAQGLIEKNKQRKEKKLKAMRGVGDFIEVYEAFNEKQEGEFIAKKIRDNIRNDNGFGLNDVAIFYRTHAQSRSLEESFLNNSIPYRIIGGVSFYERREIKDILAYLKLIYNSSDMVSLNRIINVPARGIGASITSKIKDLGGVSGIESQMEFFDQRTAKNLKGFINLYKEMRNKAKEETVFELISFVIKITGYKDYLLDGTSEGETRWENLKELMSVAKRFENMIPEESLGAFLHDVSLVSDLDNQDFNKESVSLMTLHSAKGLEFDYVFMVGMEEGIFPHSQSFDDPSQVEEERRLCYVGLTRARKKLYLIFTNSRMLYGGVQSNLPSRFLDEMPQNVIKYS